MEYERQNLIVNVADSIIERAEKWEQSLAVFYFPEGLKNWFTDVISLCELVKDLVNRSQKMHEERLNSYGDKLKSLKYEIDQLEDKKVSYGKRLVQAKNIIEDLKESLKQKQVEIGNKEQKIENQRVELANCNEKIKELSEENERLKEKVKNTQKIKEVLKKVKEDLDGIIHVQKFGPNFDPSGSKYMAKMAAYKRGSIAKKSLQEIKEAEKQWQ